jgi:hypothetical protein
LFSVISDHDTEKPRTTTMQSEKNKPGDDVVTTGYKREGTDKTVSTKAGTVSNGVRTVSRKDATEIRKANGLKTTNAPVGVIPYKKTN